MPPSHLARLVRHYYAAERAGRLFCSFCNRLPLLLPLSSLAPPYLFRRIRLVRRLRKAFSAPFGDPRGERDHKKRRWNRQSMYASSFKNITVGPKCSSLLLRRSSRCSISPFALSEHGPHKDLEELHSLTCAGNGGGSSFNGAFLPECVSDQCFRSTAGANAVPSLFLCQWKYALIRFMATERARERCCPRRRVGLPGTPRRRWWPQQQHNEKRFSENRARIWTAIEVRLRPHCADGHGRLRVTDGGGGGLIRRRHVLIACFAIQDVGEGGRR